MTALKIFHIIISWNYKKQQYQQELIITAPNKEEAKEKAKNRLPVHLLKSQDAEDSVKIIIHDLGTPENRKTYYSSKLQTSSKTKNTLPLEYQTALMFAVLWGHETGYRAGNPYISGSEQMQLEQLYHFENKEKHLYDLAVAYLADGNADPNEYFRDHLSSILGEIVPEVNQIAPAVNLTEIESAEDHSREMINKAKKEAQSIMQTAQAQADEQLDKLIELGHLLDNMLTHIKNPNTMIDNPAPIPENLNTEPDLMTDIEQNTIETLPFEEFHEELPFEDTHEDKKEPDIKNKPTEPPATPVHESQPASPPRSKTKVFKKQAITLDITDIKNELPKEDRPVITEDDISEEFLIKILKDCHITENGTTRSAMSVYNSYKDQSDRPAKDLLFHVLSQTDTVGGYNGWDRLCRTCRSKLPNCIFDLKIPELKMTVPYKQTA